MTTSQFRTSQLRASQNSAILSLKKRSHDWENRVARELGLQSDGSLTHRRGISDGPILSIVCDGNPPVEKDAPYSTHHFGTGDVFALLCEDPKNRAVEVCPKLTKHGAHDLATQLYECVALCWAARENGACSIVLQLPQLLDPVLNPSPLATLVVKMAKAAGVRDIRYVDDGSPSQTDAYLQQLQSAMSEASKQREVLSVAKQLSRIHAFARRRGLQLASYADMLAALQQKFAEVPATPESSRRLVFIGSANPALGQAVAHAMMEKSSNTEIAHHVYEAQFPNVVLNTDVAGATVTIVQSTRPEPGTPAALNDAGVSTYLFEAMLLALQARDAGAARIEMVFPYQVNARSDKRESKPGNYVGAYASLIGRICDELHVDHTVLVEPHDPHARSYFSNRCNRGSMIEGLRYLVQIIVDRLGEQRDQAVLVAPDEGATKRTRALRDLLQIEMLSAQKMRDRHSDTSAIVTNLAGGKLLDKDKVYVVSDDETMSGGTLCQTLIKLREQGAADIRVAIAHNNMPLDAVERNLCMARFMWHGAREIHFLDTQPMGIVVANWQELGAMAQATGWSEQALRAWAEKNVFNGRSDAALYQTWTAQFATLQQQVHVHSSAQLIANELTTIATL